MEFTASSSMKRLLALVALCLPIYILAQGFGSFTHDQPYFSANTSSQSNDPPDFPNAFVDYDVGDTNTNGDLIATLFDRTTNKFHLKASGTERPYWTNTAAFFNGHGFLAFDGVNNMMRTNFGAKAQPTTFYLVLSLSTVSATQTYLDSAATTSSEFYRTATEHGLFCGSTLTAANITSGLKCVVTLVLSSAGNDVMKTNNVQWSTGTAGNNALTGITLGANRSSSAKNKFNVARVIGYTGEHSAGTQLLVYNWLRDKYFP